MGTPSPLHGNRNPAPGKHDKPGAGLESDRLRFRSAQVIKHIIKAGRTISIDIIQYSLQYCIGVIHRDLSVNVDTGTVMIVHTSHPIRIELILMNKCLRY